VEAQAQFDSSGASPRSKASSQQLRIEKSDLRKITKMKEAKDHEGFVDAVSQVLDRDKNHLEALNALAVHYIDRNKEGLAKLILNRALDSHSKSHTLHNNLGIIYLSEGEQRKAINAFKKAIELKPSYEIGLANLGSVYVEYGDYAKAVEPLEEGYQVVKSQVKKRDATAVEVANNYAVALAGVAQFDKAKPIYEFILDSDSRNVGVLYNYSALLIENLQDAKEGRKILSRLKFIADDSQLLKKVKKLEAQLEQLEQKNK